MKWINFVTLWNISLLQCNTKLVALVIGDQMGVETEKGTYPSNTNKCNKHGN